MVEGRLEFDVAAEMALVGKWRRWPGGVSDTSQAEKEDERVRIQDV